MERGTKLTSGSDGVNILIEELTFWTILELSSQNVAASFSYQFYSIQFTIFVPKAATHLFINSSTQMHTHMHSCMLKHRPPALPLDAVFQLFKPQLKLAAQPLEGKAGRIPVITV